jgi:hypothetical protein
MSMPKIFVREEIWGLWVFPKMCEMGVYNYIMGRWCKVLRELSFTLSHGNRHTTHILTPAHVVPYT